MSEDRKQKIRAAAELILAGLGEDLTRDGLKDTPTRVAKAWLELVLPNDTPPPRLTTFDRVDDGVDQDQMIVVSDIPFYSFCEHHMLPFFGVAHIGYLPDRRIVGLSKFARTVDHFARRLQVQERLTAQVAEYIMSEVAPHGVVVQVTAEHMCMSMRGIAKPGHRTVTQAIRGQIDKMEFIELLKVRQ